MIEYHASVVQQVAKQEDRRESIIDGMRTAIQSFEQLSARERKHDFLN